MQAETLHCPTCGAAASSDATHCEFCGARLKTVACPRCFAMMFVGSQYCPHCGAKADAASSLAAEAGRAAASCPRCRVPLESIAVGSASLKECPRCDGLWVDVAAFERIVNEREEQAAVLGAPSLMPKHAGGESDRVRYVPCPLCGQLMNRVNFARCSGVVVDVCKGHGTWFDRDELRQIVEFIRGGGLSVSREREKQEVEAERQKLKREQLSASLQSRRLGGISESEDRRGVVSAAGELLGLLLDW